MDLKSMGRKIKEQRIKNNMSQEKLAELVDVTPSYISNLESGNRSASLKTTLDIVNVLNMSFDYLMFESMTYNHNEFKMDNNLVEFRNILEKIQDKELIQDYITYCRGIANSMLEIKNNK